MAKERVLDLQISKKVSFDGKSYLVRLPAQLVHFLQKNRIVIEKMIMKGIWKVDEGGYGILIIFKDKIENENNESYDEKEFVVLN